MWHFLLTADRRAPPNTTVMYVNDRHQRTDRNASVSCCVWGADRLVIRKIRGGGSVESTNSICETP
ncbi:hypothetical protein M378DRAFT_159963 [Amanita muscaria Koide BX008]|uniref:Uncharacterized protein n=1 Tax=Amanita muscaria (strain Koide BX008) TaxID=946122 RepID=A0A0C2TJ81_AMAMK|nr:hypothetical protein M378DRAFT_159963 [Amanita muscaria Koide BX008]